MEVSNAMTYVYLQPISASLNSQRGRDGQVFPAENHLQLDGLKFFSSKSRRAPLKVKDILKINKQYKVYNRIIHFYNFLYEVEINNDFFQQLPPEHIKISLLSKNYRGESKHRNYLVGIQDLLKEYAGEGIQTSTETIHQDGFGDDSDLVLHVVKSNSSLSLVTLEQILGEKKSQIFSELGEGSKNSGQFNIVLKQSVNNEALSTVASNDQWGGRLGKISRKSEITLRSSLTRHSKLKERQIENDKTERIIKGINESPVRKQTSENTCFLEESPKLKRFNRLIRSCVRPSSLHCEMDEVDTLEPFFKVKNELMGYFHNVLVLLGIVMIFYLMHPSSRT